MIVRVLCAAVVIQLVEAFALWWFLGRIVVE